MLPKPKAYNPTIGNNDIEKLVNFIGELESDLKDFVDNFDILIPKHRRFKKSFTKAWIEVLPLFPSIVDYLTKNQPLDQLSLYGLTGYQLDLKLKLISFTREEVNNARHAFLVLDEAEKDRNDSHRARMWKDVTTNAARLYQGAKKRLLYYNDTPLGSLLGAIPICGDPIVEIKDTAINLLQDEESKTKS